MQPLIPTVWRWVALRHLPYHGKDITFFATREHEDGRFRIYATTDIDTTYPLEVFDEDVSAKVKVLDPSVRHVALRRPDRVLLLLGQTGPTTGIVPIELGDLIDVGSYNVRLYDSEAYTWRDGEFEAGQPGNACAVSIEAGGFRLLSLEKRGSAPPIPRVRKARATATRTPRRS